jgi:hypothetical protein
MTRLLFALALSACWTTPTTEPVHPAPSGGGGGAIREARPCSEGGDRLALVICRDGDAVTWTVTNKTEVPLWVFVAPPGHASPYLRRENAAARASHGAVLLSKKKFLRVGDHPMHTGAVELAPGESDQGAVVVGDVFDPGAPNFTGVAFEGDALIESVTLEVGFVEVSPAFRPQPAPKPDPFVILMRFDPSQQEIVTVPPVPWR